MAQAKGSKAYLAFQEETTYKTDPGTPNLTTLQFESETLSKKVGMEQSNTLRGSRNSVQPLRGDTDVSGGVNVNLAAYPAQLWKACLGSCTTTGASAPYTHTIKVGDTVPSYLIEKGFTDIAQYFKYNGCKFSGFKLECTTKGVQKVSFDIMGATGAASGTSFDATRTDLGISEFDGFAISSLLEGGSSITGVTGISLAYSNESDGDTFTLGGGGVRGAINEGVVKVTGTIKGLFENLTLYNKAVNRTESSLLISYILGTGAGTAGNEFISFEIPELFYEVADPPVAGPKGVSYSLNFTGFYKNDSDASPLIIVVKNTQATL